MGLFGKNKKEESNSKLHSGTPSLPELPKLPKLPQIPPANSSMHSSSQSAMTAARPNALPRFPSGSLGDKFSQNTIKDAVSGEKESDVVDEFEDEIQKMPLPEKAARKMPERSQEKRDMNSGSTMSQPPRYKRPEMPQEDIPMPQSSEVSPSVMTSAPARRYSAQKPVNEPVFIRIDKFEESMDTFEKIKKQISGVDKLLNEVKQIKEKEERELQDWQQKLESMKNQIEKIDKDIFSKIE